MVNLIRHGSLLLLASQTLLFVAACDSFGRRDGVAPGPPDAQTALARINANQEQLDQTLHYPECKTSFRFRDSAGKDHRYIGQDAVLFFRGPRSILFNVKSLAGVMAQFGSTGERYWLWVDSEGRRLWWGSWARVGQSGGRKLPIPPGDLLDALLLRPLPDRLTQEHPVELRRDKKGPLLVYQRAGGGLLRRSGVREIRLQPDAPYMPLEIIDRAPDGTVLMRAELGDYRRVGENGPVTPRRYVVVWPQEGAEFRLDVHRAKFRPDLEDFCEFPEQFDGAVEPLDGTSASPR